MDRSQVIARTEHFVREELYDDSSGHDWWHVHRVRSLAVALAREESADLYVVELAALLHDISDHKLNGGDHEKGPRIASEWLLSLGESTDCAVHVAQIIRSVSFKGSGGQSTMETAEGKVVQDADRLDAIGAIGVARAFAYGGHSGEMMHDPSAFHASPRPAKTVTGHFHEKLFLLKERMNTPSARRLAEHRHHVMEVFLREFLTEWDAGDVSEAR